MKLDDSSKIMIEVHEKLAMSNLVSPLEKFESLMKNPDVERLWTEKELASKIKMKFAPVVSADVERSFSMTKKVLATDRASFTEENLRLHYIIEYNSFLM